MIPTIITALYLSIIAFDFRVISKNASKLNKVLYLVILTTGFAVVLLHELGVNIASPTGIIEHVTRAIFNVD